MNNTKCNVMNSLTVKKDINPPRPSIMSLCYYTPPPPPPPAQVSVFLCYSTLYKHYVPIGY